MDGYHPASLKGTENDSDIVGSRKNLVPSNYELPSSLRGLKRKVRLDLEETELIMFTLNYPDAEVHQPSPLYTTAVLRHPQNPDPEPWQKLPSNSEPMMNPV